MIDLHGFESYILKESSLEIVQRGETQWDKATNVTGVIVETLRFCYAYPCGFSYADSM